MTEIQRHRMIAAAVETVAELGYARTTVARVTGRAGVSRKTFYEVFVDREDCLLGAFEQALSEAMVITRDASRRDSSWQGRIRRALAGLLTFMDEQPAVARLCVVELQAAGERVLCRRREVLAEAARAIDEGRSTAGPAAAPPLLIAEGVVGAVASVLHTRLLEERNEPLADLLGPLMSIIVLPYRGARAASRELTRAAPPVSLASPPPAGGNDPLAGLGMRLTYRTVRVMMFIADHPGASNREIAETSGVKDQGQISRLLGRLARLGLAENVGEGQPRGAANAWRLTPHGARLERAARPRG